uniref:phosphatase n=1 Tax=Clostridium sp. 12(A) TaxID=1163671 RepID=UPI0004AD1AE9|nr:phosphatase [Clostridium sp. 12(A)]
MIKHLTADLHTHTDVSKHGYSTVYENIMAAKAAGLTHVGISNHGPALDDGAPEGHFRNLRAIPEMVEGIRVYRGAELNITDYNGSIDLSGDTIRNRLDYTIASFHDEVIPPGSLEDHTSAYLSIAANPLVDIIGHSGTPGFSYDYERVIPEFKRYEKAVEINEATFHVRKQSVENCMNIARLCALHGVFVIVNSDAHFCKLVGVFHNALEMLRQINFPEELILNEDGKRLEAWLQRRNLLKEQGI